MPDVNQPKMIDLTLKTTAVHTVTYFLVGLPMFFLFNYSEGFAAPELACWMRPTDDPMVMAGVLFQPIRGVIFGLAFFPIRAAFFGKRRGWLGLWWLLIALGILSTFGPAPGSVEGLVYTILPVSLSTYLEVTLQSLALSGLLVFWVNHPEKKWLTRTLWIVFFLLLGMVIMGLVTSGA